MAEAQKSLSAFGGKGGAPTPANGKPGQKVNPRAMTPSMKALSQMVGGDKGAFFNGPGSAAEQEVEALRAHFQAQIDGLRAQLEAASAANASTSGSGSWEAAAPMHEELEALRAFVEKEISGLKQGLAAAGAAGAGAGAGSRSAFTPPLSDDDTAAGDDSVIRPRGLGQGGMQQQQAAAVPPPIVLGSYSAAVTAALAQAAQNDPDEDDDDDYYGEEERKYQSAREALRQQELQRFRSQMAERGRRMSGSFTPQHELRSYGGAGGLM